jgi:uncharacterized membrane protein
VARASKRTRTAAAAAHAAVAADPAASEVVIENVPAATRGRYAAILAGIALAGTAIAAYLTWVKLTGGVPACGPLAGCETVQTSDYSTIMGIPVSVLGLAYQLTILALVVTWWRTGDRRALMATYALGLVGVAFAAYLVYLQLFVIGAVCTWCAAFDALVVAGFIAAVVTYVRTAER